MTRQPLPNRRPQVTFGVTHGFGGKHNEFIVSIGGDGSSENPLEVFVSGLPSKQMNIMRDAAILTSLALQHGCPLETIAHALTKEDDGQPATPIGSVVAGMMGQVTP